MKRVSSLSLAVIAALYGSASYAVVEDPQSVRLGVFDVTPMVKAGFGYDDNVFREGGDGDPLKEKKSAVYSLAPSVEFRAESGASYYLLNIDAEHKRFATQKDHNFTNVGADLDLNHEFNSRNRFQFTSGYGIEHDQGSATDGINDIKAPRNKHLQVGAVYGFGSTEAIARIDLFGDYDKKDYTRGGNDRNTKTYGATGYYQFMPKTDVLLEIKRRDLTYSQISNAGYQVMSYLTGLNWEATEKTTGFAKIGYRKRKSDVSGVKDEGYTGWEVGVSYAAVEYSVIQVSSGRDYGLESENPADASFTRGLNASVSWDHDWTSKISTTLGFSYTDDDVENAASVLQKERTVKTVSAGVSWKPMRNVTVSFDWENTKRDEKAKATGASEDNYKRNAYMITAELAM